MQFQVLCHARPMRVNPEKTQKIYFSTAIKPFAESGIAVKTKERTIC
jgi:hypothetical protein